MTLEELDRLLEDRSNRPLGIFYRCAADPRVIAPSRPPPAGWQINLAHRHALATFLLYLGVLAGPVALVGWLGPRAIVPLTFLVGGAFALSVVFLIGLSAHLSRRHVD